jgi:hypothetical protein
VGSSDSKSYTFGFNVRRVREYLLGKCICYSLAPHFLGPINSIHNFGWVLFAFFSGGCFSLSGKDGNRGIFTFQSICGAKPPKNIKKL